MLANSVRHLRHLRHRGSMLLPTPPFTFTTFRPAESAKHRKSKSDSFCQARNLRSLRSRTDGARFLAITLRERRASGAPAGVRRIARL